MQSSITILWRAHLFLIACVVHANSTISDVWTSARHAWTFFVLADLLSIMRGPSPLEGGPFAFVRTPSGLFTRTPNALFPISLRTRTFLVHADILISRYGPLSLARAGVEFFWSLAFARGPFSPFTIACVAREDSILSHVRTSARRARTFLFARTF